MKVVPIKGLFVVIHQEQDFVIKTQVVAVSVVLNVQIVVKQNKHCLL